jgi:hypothetical protein
MTMTSRGSTVRVSLALVTALALLSGCGSDRLAAPTGVRPAAATASHGGTRASGTDDPQFLTADSSAPTIANPVIAFWAKKGVDTTVYMYYHARAGHNDSTTFMRFRVRAKSLLARPDGSLIANGDSVLITVTLTDSVAMKLEFQPSGLQFSSHDQAVLKLSFGDCYPTSSGNSVQSLRIWRKESPLDPWLPLSSVVTEGTSEVQANIGGFTGYAMAY